ncbi:C40 family peptidase [Nocardiopsis sp. LOL_012]|uniref:C40 family peptidase n=1 Tax=Nocardiopsis sp. LOL_012 TaxID=3345409 RepID=UPI003A83A4CD
MRSRFTTCVGATAAVAVAFTALGAAPVWAEPVVEDRPPLSEQFSSGTDPRADESAVASPEVADPERLRADVRVAPFAEARSVEYFAVAQESLPRDVVGRVRRIDGVDTALTVDAARVGVDGEPLSLLGVNPSSFRNHAPRPSAESDEIWRGVAEGRIALSNEVGTERSLDLGSEVTAAGGRGAVDLEVWTHATSGIAGIDALVSRERAADLGMPHGNALVVSAPDADLWELYDALTEVLGEDVSLQLVADDAEPPVTGEAVAPSIVEEVIAHAESQIGVPYVWGGESPEDGFDCSGLLQWAFARAGVAIPRVTHDQWNAGERLDLSQARRGDLLFWRTDPTAPDYISHVAIYLGEGMMLEAPRTGLSVRVTPVRTDSFAGVVRIHA